MVIVALKTSNFDVVGCCGRRMCTCESCNPYIACHYQIPCITSGCCISNAAIRLWSGVPVCVHHDSSSRCCPVLRECLPHRRVHPFDGDRGLAFMPYSVCARWVAHYDFQHALGDPPSQ